MGDRRWERGHTDHNKGIKEFVNAAQVNAIRPGKSADALVAGTPMSGVDPAATLAFSCATRTLREICKKRHTWRFFLLDPSGLAAG